MGTFGVVETESTAQSLLRDYRLLHKYGLVIVNRFTSVECATKTRFSFLLSRAHLDLFIFVSPSFCKLYKYETLFYFLNFAWITTLLLAQRNNFSVSSFPA